MKKMYLMLTNNERQMYLMLANNQREIKSTNKIIILQSIFE